MSGGTAERRNGGTMHGDRLQEHGSSPGRPGLRRSAASIHRSVHPSIVSLVLGLLAASPAAAQDQIGLPLGATPQAVTVEDLDGNAVDLGEWIGKTPVVFQFWATWCPICESLEPSVRAARTRWGDSVTFVVVAVGVNQSPRRVRRYLDQHPDMGVVVWDGKGGAVRAFEAPGTSYVVALDASGKVVYTGFGADQDIAGAFSAAIR